MSNPADNSVDLVLGLVSLGADLTLPLLPDLTVMSLLRAAATKCKVSMRILEVLQLLISNGAVPDAQVLADAACNWASEDPRTLAAFKFLASHLVDIVTDGKLALVNAAAFNKFNFVQYLLDLGTPADATIDMGLFGCETTILASAFAREPYYPGPYPSCEMVRLLVERGAKCNFAAEDTRPLDFVEYILVRASLYPQRLYKQAAYIISYMGNTIRQAPLESDCLLDAAFAFEPNEGIQDHTLKLSESLLRFGVEVQTPYALAGLIRAGARREFIKELLNAGAPINASRQENPRRLFRYVCRGEEYAVFMLTPLQASASRCDEELVTLLLSLHADVNHPAKGHQGSTALQGACAWMPVTPSEGEIKLKIAKLLLEHGADTNAAPAWSGYTALQRAAFLGDLELATLLLRHGADIQAPFPRSRLILRKSRIVIEKTALDMASHRGRLDMVKLLLNANGLSGVRGVTGYDGAIHLAHDCDHFAIVDLIRRHAAENERLGRPNPHLIQPKRSFREYYGIKPDEK